MKNEQKKGETNGLTLVIKNMTDEVQEAILFGYAENYLKQNFGSDRGITIHTKDSEMSYKDVLLTTNNEEGYKVCYFTIQSENELQKTQSIITVKESGYQNGSYQEVCFPIILMSYVDSKNSSDIPLLVTWQWDFKKGSQFIIPVRPNTELEICFNPDLD